MMQVNNIIKEGKKYKKSLIFLFIMYLIILIGTSKIIVGFFYFKNGSSFILDNHEIKFHFSHWAYFGENHLAYVIAGRNIDSKNLSAEFFKNTEEINILKVISNCDTIKKQEFEGKNIKGNIYLCTRNKIETMYFQSDDKKIFIRENDYNSSNMKIVEEYELLLNSIKLKKLLNLTP